MYCVEINKGEGREHFRLTISSNNWDNIQLSEGSLNQNKNCPEFHLVSANRESPERILHSGHHNYIPL